MNYEYSFRLFEDKFIYEKDLLILTHKIIEVNFNFKNVLFGNLYKLSHCLLLRVRNITCRFFSPPKAYLRHGKFLIDFRKSQYTTNTDFTLLSWPILKCYWKNFTLRRQSIIPILRLENLVSKNIKSKEYLHPLSLFSFYIYDVILSKQYRI